MIRMHVTTALAVRVIALPKLSIIILTEWILMKGVDEKRGAREKFPVKNSQVLMTHV